MQSETGVVEEKSDYATNDLFIDHDSHDQAFDVRPDASSQFLLSDANIEDKDGLIENEWESADFPTWSSPNVGDRVWVHGNWVLDCNHEEETSHHFDAEIHPINGIATMTPPSLRELGRSTRRGLPDSGVDREVEVGVDAARDVHACRPEPEANPRHRADRDCVVAGLEVNGVSAAAPGADTDGRVAST
jgi:hypothetical protein